MKELWNCLCDVFKDYVSLPNLSPQSATLGFTSNIENSILINHIVLLFKYYVYKSRKDRNINILPFINFLTRVYDTEKALSIKKKNLTEKWAPTAAFFDAFTKQLKFQSIKRAGNYKTNFFCSLFFLLFWFILGVFFIIN